MLFGFHNAFTGVSSNGRTRDFGSLYHGSNPCAPTKNLNAHRGVLIYFWTHGSVGAGKVFVHLLPINIISPDNNEIKHTDKKPITGYTINVINIGINIDKNIVLLDVFLLYIPIKTAGNGIRLHATLKYPSVAIDGKAITRANTNKPNSKVNNLTVPVLFIFLNSPVIIAEAAINEESKEDIDIANNPAKPNPAIHLGIVFCIS